MHANPNNLSNFNTPPKNVVVLPSATPVLEPEVFDGNPANTVTLLMPLMLLSPLMFPNLGGNFSIS